MQYVGQVLGSLFCIFALRHSQFCQFPPRLHCRYDWVNPRGKAPADGTSSGARCDDGGGSKFQWAYRRL